MVVTSSGNAPCGYCGQPLLRHEQFSGDPFNPYDYCVLVPTRTQAAQMLALLNNDKTIIYRSL